MASFQPAPDCKHVQHQFEIACELLEMGAEPLHVFHIAKEALYDVAHGVKVVVVGDLFAGIALKWNDCQCPLIGIRCLILRLPKALSATTVTLLRHAYRVRRLALSCTTFGQAKLF